MPRSHKRNESHEMRTEWICISLLRKVEARQLFLLLCTAGLFPTLPSSGKTKSKNPSDKEHLLELNKRVHRENNAPEDFPSFVGEGYEVKVGASENYVKRDFGL
ncbi:hypothetical protein RJ639_026481, partial [Escallonia herrerae]